ncbi:hypothetical protein ALI22I_41110 [Saccharothrix sp. ALI-22-I]|uniref:hypothetical protein n=1 Tax=Saccharothrix sp. ALI-22-I TaxID=1933778 RepID=UPI00097BF622|nr:hypothetical protein [Saccharothrix sp. ALI-22-I]ONI82472.1 hypothetical protein ALI22I_41110 [Saccharothrix sp. ALI-22-I]
MTTPNDPYNQQQPGGYPPAAPPLNESELRPPARPKSVDTAYLLWLVAAGIGILSNLIGFVIASDIAAETGVETGAGTSIVSLIFAVLWILVVMQMRKGANWARIVLTVLGGLSTIGNLLSLLAFGILFSIGFLGVISALFVVASLVTIIAAIVFMFMPDSNYYFKAS